MPSPSSPSVAFFERQFARQIAAAEFELNPFEQAALPRLHGEVLDLGCGLGNLSIALAARGSRVSAIDASAPAVESLQRRARALGLAVDASRGDLRGWRPRRQWDGVACIGLLMFFAPAHARAGLAAVRSAVRPGGVAAVNVLVEGTTYLAMFGDGPRCLFAAGEVRAAFAGWEILLDESREFPAPDATVKRFETVIAHRPTQDLSKDSP
ncbi:MAG TPA: class I SAM-dependent methyltransferase [Myxococcota bacterium]|nr:class I SAM-dependent methyltransferase [Myxococcota bacterium]